MIASLSSSPPTSMPYSNSPDSYSHSHINNDNMVRSSSAEPAKSSKRKGTRSVSTLTPSQLARKRANDREAQRAIRARTKEHIDRLERELEDLKSKQSRDQTVQELLRRNQALEEELMRLKENMGVSMTSSPYSAPGTALSVTIPATTTSPHHSILTTPSVYDDNLSTGSGAIPSPRGSPYPSGDYSPLPDYGQQYVLPNNCESWASTVPCPVPSNVSSPSSSADDYSAGYIPTSVPTSMLASSNTSSSNVSAVGHSHKEVIKMEYEDVDSHVSRRRIPPQQPFASARVPPYLHGSTPATRLEHVSRLLPSGPVLGPLKGQPQPGLSWPGPVLTTPPACRFDELLVGFLQDCRRMTTAASLAHTLGPPQIDVRSVFRSHDSHGQLGCSPHPITDLVRSLIDTAGMTRLTERLAIFAPLQTMICWLAQPTSDRRAQLCDNYVPCERQFEVPHPQWLDLLLWGSLRDAVIERQDLYATDEFLRVYFDALRLVNWHCQPLDSLVTDPRTGHVGLTDAFMVHAMNGSNWRLNATFAQRYPELCGLVSLE
ncbi:hypothetical protein FHETE_708 [Fusarium heterosporum]|uniref:BZIP transcription factor n=1 Tax=Fusarium heterosporum TaxID=42747 RepID=A0A8H5WY06_FUSHE|nr:hypothetical protein FHETE_708 [Fusarium heterosporum]